jgi:hypothetical protein
MGQEGLGKASMSCKFETANCLNKSGVETLPPENKIKNKQWLLK